MCLLFTTCWLFSLSSFSFFFFFFNDTATTEIYTLSLHDALPILTGPAAWRARPPTWPRAWSRRPWRAPFSWHPRRGASSRDISRSRPWLDSGEGACRARRGLRGHGSRPGANRSDRGEPVLPGGERPGADRDEGSGRRERWLSSDESGPGPPHEPADPGDRAGDPGGARRPTRPRLQAAAVVGHDVPYRLLQAITEGPEDTRRGGLARLQAAEFLYEARLFPDLEEGMIEGVSVRLGLTRAESPAG